MISYVKTRTASVLNLFFLPSTNFSASFLALDSAPQTNFLVQDELPDDTNPAAVVGQVLVKLLGNLVDLPKSGPGDGGEVVVLIVQANVVGQEVEGSVVRESLGDRDTVLGVARLLVLKRSTIENVVLGDEMAGYRVQGSCKETAQDEVSYCFSSPRLNQNIVEQELDSNVEGVDLGQRDLVDHHRSQSVEQDLECAEKGLAGDRVKEEGLESGGEIGVEAIDAERLVVGKVVRLAGGQ